MDLAMAKQLLSTCVKYELRDHAFGDVEVEWYDGDKHVASGMFSGSIHEIGVHDAEEVFVADEADELRTYCASERVERNDLTGPTEFKLGKTMPGLTTEGVRKELTGE